MLLLLMLVLILLGCTCHLLVLLVKLKLLNLDRLPIDGASPDVLHEGPIDSAGPALNRR